MPASYVSELTLPTLVDDEIQNVTYTIKDAEARTMIQELGQALYWLGVTTTALTDGATTNPVTVNGESVEARVGAVAQYGSREFAWNGSAWQEFGVGDLGSLAFKNSASGSYTPAGSVSVSSSNAGTTTVNSITAVGTLPSFSYTSNNETLVFSQGTLPTKGSNQTVLTSVGTLSGSFSGTAATITVS